MKTRTKVTMSIIAILLSGVLLFISIMISNRTEKTGFAKAKIRTVELSENIVEAQSILNEFDNATLTTEGSTTYFEGYKSLDNDSLYGIDYISETEIDVFEVSKIKYNFSYNYETNVVSLSAKLLLSDGSVEFDEIYGVGFINKANEIDAVMNIDGDAILLSEMREDGLIQNCGWFSRFIKKAAVVVACGAALVAAGALIVATAGAAAPAVVGASVIAASALTATALSIASYATVTAVIAAGVALTAELWEKYYPGIDATSSNVNGTQIITAQWSKDKTKEAIKELVRVGTKKQDPSVFFRVTKYSTSVGPVTVELKGYTQHEMSVNMTTQGWSSLTYAEHLAKSVLIEAFPAMQLSGLHLHGMPHYHMVYPGTLNEVKSNNYTIHSYYSDLIAV